MDTKAESRTIVVPIEFTNDSTLAVDLARVIARPGDHVELVHVIPFIDEREMVLPEGISADTIIRAVYEDANRRLDTVEAGCAMPSGVEVSSICLNGNPGEEIVKHVAALGAWLVVMETAGKGAARRMMIGSVADHVARSADSPVLLVRESEGTGEETSQIRRLVVPVEPSMRSTVPIAFAAELSKRLSVPVALVSVRSVDQNAYMYGTAMTFYVSEELDASLQKAAELFLQAASDKLTSQGVAVTTSVLLGPVALAIEESLRPGDLVVMSSHGRSGVRRWLLGSVAEHLIRKGSAPVVLVPFTAASREQDVALT